MNNGILYDIRQCLKDWTDTEFFRLLKVVCPKSISLTLENEKSKNFMSRFKTQFSKKVEAVMKNKKTALFFEETAFFQPKEDEIDEETPRKKEMRKEISTLKISNKSIEVKAEKLESKVREMVQRNSVLEDNIVVEKEKVYNLDKSLEIILEDSQEKEKCLLISGP